MKKMSLLFSSMVVAVCISLYSCGSGDDTAPTVTKVTAASGSAITTTQKITLTFSKTMDTSTLALTGTMAADSNGGTWSKGTVDNDTLVIAPKTKWDGSQIGTLTVAAKDPSGKPITAEDLSYGIKVTFTNFKAASVVIGQADFAGLDSNQGDVAAANTVSSPYGMPSYVDGALFLGDYSNSRTLKFNSIPTTNNKAADAVLGQANFTTIVSGTAANELGYPEGSAVADGKLFVLDYDNSRILIYNTIPTTNQPTANVVVGQTGFGLSDTGTTSQLMDYPEGMYVAGGKLIVTDSSNNRVLIWNTIPTTNGKAADVVLGQADFTHNTDNDDNQDGTSDMNPTARTLDYPDGVWSDGTKLVVSDGDNNRVLIWNKFPTTNFVKADVVLGQADFTHNAANDDNQDSSSDANPSARTFSFPYFGVYSNGTQLIITDEGNSRTLIWNTFPTTNFAKADIVLGQGDFSHGTSNDANQDNTDDGMASAKTQAYPSGVLLVGDKLIVTDENNSRYLIYQGE